MHTQLPGKKFKNKGFLGFLLLLGFFLLPILLADICYRFLDIEGSKTNQGSLLEKSVQLSDLQLNKQLAQDLAITNTDPWHNRWTIIQHIPQSCNEICMQNIYKLQQVHIALGKNVNRVQRLHLYPATSNLNFDKKFIKAEIYQQFPHLTIASSPKLQQSSLSNSEIYLADPHGNIILSYKISDPEFDKKILKDTKKLLNISRIG